MSVHQPKERKCMGPCGEMFMSRDAGHRYCPKCAKILQQKNYGRVATGKSNGKGDPAAGRE